MKKPEYLTGECETYIEFCDPDSIYACHYRDNWPEVRRFKYQPFAKDMIVRPKMSETYVSQMMRSQEEITEEWHNWEPLFKGEWKIEHGIFLVHFESQQSFDLRTMENWTTDDFIREAKKVGIKLEWK